MLLQFTEIKYKNKVHAIGYIIDSRKYRWCLKRQYEPCWAKNGHFISVLSPHKTDFVVYIPKSEIKKNMKLTICNRNERLEYKVINVRKHTFDVKEIIPF
jgi:hypothetical protein